MDYCISDIHGHYDLFCRLLDKIKFGGGDKLYVLGDMIDKGPDSVRLAKLLFSMPNVCCIAGNLFSIGKRWTGSNCCPFM